MGNYKLFTTAKRHNSTLVPTSGVDADLALKQGQSLLKPTFLLEFASKPTATMLEYEGRYYFVNDVRAIRTGLWELDCEVDPLSTYKADILATNAFVMYDTTANTEIIDKRLSVKTTTTISTASSSSGSFFESTCVLLGIVGKQHTGVFAVSVATARDLLNDINTDWLDDPDMLEIPDVSDFSNWDDAAGAFMHNLTVGIRQLIATGKAGDCIKSAVIVPVGANKFTGSSQTIWLGDYNTGVSGLLLDSSQRAVETQSVSIPWQFNDWRRNSPYTNVYLNIPYVGVIGLPTSQIMYESSLSLTIFVSSNGNVTYNIYGGTSHRLISRCGANCGSSFMIGSSNINPLGSSMATAGVAGAGIVGALATTVPGLIAAGTAAITGTIAAITAEPICVGSTGGGIFSDGAVIQCATLCRDTTVTPDSVSAVMGTPTMETKSLSGLTGYVETRNFSVSGAMTDTEREMINRLMDGGVYIE